jgi:hypothetical protein
VDVNEPAFLFRRLTTPTVDSCLISEPDFKIFAQRRLGRLERYGVARESLSGSTNALEEPLFLSFCLCLGLGCGGGGGSNRIQQHNPVPG